MKVERCKCDLKGWVANVADTYKTSGIGHFGPSLCPVREGPQFGLYVSDEEDARERRRWISEHYPDPNRVCPVCKLPF